MMGSTSYMQVEVIGRNHFGNTRNWGSGSNLMLSADLGEISSDLYCVQRIRSILSRQQSSGSWCLSWDTLKL